MRGMREGNRQCEKKAVREKGENRRETVHEGVMKEGKRDCEGNGVRGSKGRGRGAGRRKEGCVKEVKRNGRGENKGRGVNE